MDRFSRLTLDTYSVMGLITSILSWMLSTPETCNVTGLSSLFVAFMLYRNYPPLKPLTPALASILNNPTAVSTASTSSTTRMDISGYADGSAFSIKPISAAASVRLISSLYLLRKGTVHGSCPPIHANARPTTAMTTAVIPSRAASGSCTNWATCGDAHPARMKLSDTINTKIFLISISLFILFPQIVHFYLGEVPEGRRGRQTKNARCQYRHRALFDTSPFTWKGIALFSTILNPQLESVKSPSHSLNTRRAQGIWGRAGWGSSSPTPPDTPPQTRAPRMHSPPSNTKSPAGAVTQIMQTAGTRASPSTVWPHDAMSMRSTPSIKTT